MKLKLECSFFIKGSKRKQNRISHTYQNNIAAQCCTYTFWENTVRIKISIETDMHIFVDKYESIIIFSLSDTLITSFL
jgi:hypothetical protein